MRHFTLTVLRDDKMRYFKKNKLKNSTYDYLFIGTSGDINTTDIIAEIKKINSDTVILFDLFLRHTYNGKRFLVYSHKKDEKIDINKFNIVDINNIPKDILNISDNFFKKNLNLIDKAVMPNIYKERFIHQLLATI